MERKIQIGCLLSLAILMIACDREDNTIKNLRSIGFNADNEVDTRSNSESAEKLGNEFRVFGQKNDGTNVFGNNGYKVKYDDSNGWTYSNDVGQEDQYWDYSATSYKFAAYSIGKGDGTTSPTYASPSNTSIEGFTLSGSKAQLTSCYFTDKQVVNVNNNDFNETVNMRFNQLAAKVRIAFWEGIDGYSIKDVKFYPSRTTENVESSATVILYAESKVFPNGGSYAISYNSNNKALVNYTGTEEQKVASLTIGVLSQGTIGTSASACTTTDYLTVLPATFQTSTFVNITYTLVKDSDNTTQTKNKEVEIKTTNTVWDYQHQYTLAFEITLDGIKELIITDEWDNDYRH